MFNKYCDKIVMPLASVGGYTGIGIFAVASSMDIYSNKNLSFRKKMSSGLEVVPISLLFGGITYLIIRTGLIIAPIVASTVIMGTTITGGNNIAPTITSHFRMLIDKK